MTIREGRLIREVTRRTSSIREGTRRGAKNTLLSAEGRGIHFCWVRERHAKDTLLSTEDAENTKSVSGFLRVAARPLAEQLDFEPGSRCSVPCKRALAFLLPTELGRRLVRSSSPATSKENHSHVPGPAAPVTTSPICPQICALASASLDAAISSKDRRCPLTRGRATAWSLVAI